LGCRAIVTGAAGFVGSHLVDRLLADGASVVGIDSFEDYYPRAWKEANLRGASRHASFTLIEADIGALAAPSGPGPSRLVRLLSDADCIFHLAAQAGVRASWGTSFGVYAANNIQATQVLLEACKVARITRFVYASSSSVYGDTDALPISEDARCVPVSPYGVTKLAAEHLCRLYWRSFDLPTVALRFFTVYGPRQRPDMAFHKFIRAMLEDRPIEMFGDGEQTRDFTYVADIVDGILAAANAPSGSVYNLGGGARVTLANAVRELEACSGLKARIVHGGVQAGDVRHTWADLALAERDLGFAPKVPLDRGLSAEFAWLAEALEAGSGAEPVAD
jgi:nucleoside-diphosphate-sugar epimerase